MNAPRLLEASVLTDRTAQRRFGFISLIGFSCTILVTWETALA